MNIKNYIKYSLKDSSEDAKINSIERKHSIILRYPCTGTSICTPYTLEVKPCVYKLECWGSKGQRYYQISHPGLGAYTKGTILLTKPTKLYVYIGASGLYNSMRNKISANSALSGGGATDVRLNASDSWYDSYSLLSRIMVAAGGGGAEWASYGGNGGTLEGGSSISSKIWNVTVPYDEKCKGATQTSGSVCPAYKSGSTNFSPSTGEFGSAGYVENSDDYGGFGGGGYYGGSSYPYSFAGSGGSSFISGYKNCSAVKNKLPIEHTGIPYHYSGNIFFDTEMISGNETMPLPLTSFSKGIYDDNIGGAFRITLISYNKCSCVPRKAYLSNVIYYVLILIS